MFFIPSGLMFETSRSLARRLVRDRIVVNRFLVFDNPKAGRPVPRDGYSRLACGGAPDGLGWGTVSLFRFLFLSAYGRFSTMANVLTEWLAARYPEAGPHEFYRDLFPEGSLATAWGAGASPHHYEKGAYSAIMVRVWQGEDGSQHAERHLVTDDLDYIQTETRGDGTAWPIGVDELLYQMDELKRAPRPTYIASSGTGLHLYYLLDRPLRMWPNVIERLSAFRHRMVDLVWNRYVTREPDKPQYESVVQAFRMVGSRSRAGDQVVRAFRTGVRWSMEDLNGFVPEDCRVTPEMIGARHSIDEARRLWPEWDPEWRRKALTNPGPHNQWRVKRALFDWWCRRVEDGDTATEAFDGNRYWCVFVAACLAAKCPEVTYEELEKWAYGIQPRLDRLTKNPGNHFTAKDVSDALSAYGNPVSVKLRRDKIAEKTALPMPVNKRNGLKQAQHLYLARGRKESMKAVGIPMKNPEGRPKGSGTKADVIRQFAQEHPGLSNRKIAEALGVSRNTVNKWLRGGQAELLYSSNSNLLEHKSPRRVSLEY